MAYPRAMIDDNEDERYDGGFRHEMFYSDGGWWKRHGKRPKKSPPPQMPPEPEAAKEAEEAEAAQDKSFMVDSPS